MRGDAALDRLLERVWACAATSTEDVAVDLLLERIGTSISPEKQEQRLVRLTARAAAHRQAQAAALAANPDQIPDAALRLRELSALRYGVDPVLSAASMRVFAQRYPADLPQPRRQARPVPPANPPATTLSQPTTETTNKAATASGANSAVQSDGTDVSSKKWLSPPPRVKLE
jgi:hypothetical protein